MIIKNSKYEGRNPSLTLLKRLITLSMIFILLGGCSMFEKPIAERNPKDLPDVMAFQDEFTRGFMTSTEEVEDGYYLFESKTGGYTMWYPEDARMDDMYYQKKGEHFEAIQFGGNHDSTTDTAYYVRATYNKLNDVKDHELYLSLLSGTSGYDGEFEQNKKGERMYYYARRENIGETKSFYGFLALAVEDAKNQALRYKYTIICDNPKKGCDFDLDEVERQVKKIMESVEFKE